MENKTSLRNSQTRGDEGDMTTKYNAVSQMVSWNRKKKWHQWENWRNPNEVWNLGNSSVEY